MLNKILGYIYTAILMLLTVLLMLIIYYTVNIGNTYVLNKDKIKVNFRRIIFTFITVFGLVLIYNIFRKYTILSDIFYTMVFSLILAYLFNPIINYFEERNIKRIWSVLLLYLFIIGILLILAFLIIPRSSKEIKKFMLDLPFYIEKISDFIDLIYDKYYSTMGDLPPIFDGVQQTVMENIIGLENMIVAGLQTFIGGIIQIFTRIISLILTPIITLYFLVDKDYFKERFLGLIPLTYRQDSIVLFRQIDRSLSQFVRGRIIMSIYVGVATSIILFVLGIEFSIAIGFITGFADIIPYIGPLLGFLPAVFFALVNSPIKAVWIGIIFVLIQWTENNILAPKLIGNSTGLHPILVLLSIIIGGGVFGVFGMILAVPLVAIVIILYDFVRARIKIDDYLKE